MNRFNEFKDIRSVVQTNPCFVGLGNTFRKDDGLGVYIIDSLMNYPVASRITFLKAEDIIESYVFKIAMYDNPTIVLIDAIEPMDTRIEPGSILFGKYTEFFDTSSSYSTHKLSLQLSCKILEESDKEVYILGIVPANVEFGKGFTSEVKESSDYLIDTLVAFMSESENVDVIKKEKKYV